MPYKRRTHIAWPYNPAVRGTRQVYFYTYCGQTFLDYMVEQNIAPETAATCKQCQRGRARQERVRASLVRVCGTCGIDANIMPNRVGGKHECWDCRVARTGQAPRYRWRSGDLST